MSIFDEVSNSAADDQLVLGIKELADCVGLFLAARDQGEIEFDESMLSKGLMAISTLIAQAAIAGPDRRSEMMQHWIADGERKCSALIEEVKQRKTTALSEDDLPMMLHKPTGPYIPHVSHFGQFKQGIER